MSKVQTVREGDEQYFRLWLCPELARELGGHPVSDDERILAARADRAGGIVWDSFYGPRLSEETKDAFQRALDRWRRRLNEQSTDSVSR